MSYKFFKYLTLINNYFVIKKVSVSEKYAGQDKAKNIYNPNILIIIIGNASKNVSS